MTSCSPGRPSPSAPAPRWPTWPSATAASWASTCAPVGRRPASRPSASWPTSWSTPAAGVRRRPTGSRRPGTTGPRRRSSTPTSPTPAAPTGAAPTTWPDGRPCLLQPRAPGCTPHGGAVPHRGRPLAGHRGGRQRRRPAHRRGGLPRLRRWPAHRRRWSTRSTASSRRRPSWRSGARRTGAGSSRRCAAVPTASWSVGDAACAFNPVYGQGMSVAAMTAEEIDRELRAHRARTFGDLAGVSADLQRRVARINAGAWMVATGEDLRFPGTVGGRVTPADRVVRRYLDRVVLAAATDPVANAAFADVLTMTAPPDVADAPPAGAARAVPAQPPAVPCSPAAAAADRCRRPRPWPADRARSPVPDHAATAVHSAHGHPRRGRRRGAGRRGRRPGSGGPTERITLVDRADVPGPEWEARPRPADVRAVLESPQVVVRAGLEVVGPRGPARAGASSESGACWSAPGGPGARSPRSGRTSWSTPGARSPSRYRSRQPRRDRAGATIGPGPPVVPLRRPGPHGRARAGPGARRQMPMRWASSSRW